VFSASTPPPPPFYFSKIVPFMRYCGIKYCRAGQATDDNMAHAHCVLDTKGYKYTHRLCNTHCFSTATMVVRRSLNGTLYVHCLPCFAMDSLLTLTPYFLEIQYGWIKPLPIVLVPRFKRIESATLTYNQNMHLEKNIHMFSSPRRLDFPILGAHGPLVILVLWSLPNPQGMGFGWSSPPSD
jgi:hypothetical protein